MSVTSLKDIYSTVEQIIKKIPNINTFVSDFDYLNREDTKYTAIVLQQVNATRSDYYLTYNFNLGYVDRLLEDRSNELDIQSAGVLILNKIVDQLNGIEDIDVEATSFNYFTQRFLADCAGAYCNLSVSIPIETCISL